MGAHHAPLITLITRLIPPPAAVMRHLLYRVQGGISAASKSQFRGPVTIHPLRV